MKKLYTILLGSLLATPAMTAQITMTIDGEETTKTFTNMDEALTDANTNLQSVYSGKTLTYTITEDVTGGSRVLFDKNPEQNTTINFIGKKADGNNAVVTRTFENLLFANKDTRVTINFENITFDGDNKNNTYFEAESGCAVNLKNVVFQNIQSKKNANGLVNFKGNGAVKMENVTYGDGIDISNEAGMININNRDITVAGTTDVSFRITSKGITAATDFNPARTVELVLDNLSSGAVVVNNYKDASKFEVKATTGTTPAGLSLMNVGENIIYGESTVVIGEVGYSSLAEAVAAAPDSAVITLKGDQTVTSRLGVGKDLIIKSEDGATHRIISSINSGSKITLLFNNNTKETHITLENLIIDGGNKDAGTQTIEVSQKAQVYFNNVKVVNAVNTKGPVIKVMGDGVAVINGLTMDNCQWKAEDNAFIFFGNARCSIKGETNISMCIEKNHSVNCEGMILADKVDVIFNNEANERTANSDVLRGFTNLDNINFLNKAWKLEVVGENIRANVAATENSYKVVKCEGEYDEATAVETGETYEEIKKETDFNKYIVFDLPAYMTVYVANAEAPVAYVLEDGEAANYTKLEGNVLPVTGNTSFYIAAPKAQSAVHYVEVKDVGAGVDEVAVDENAPVEYYNLQGIRVENPQNGLYIKRQGNKAVKVLIK